MLRWVSDWSPSAGYVTGDIVHHGGNIYVASRSLPSLSDSPGGPMSDWWVVVS